MPTKHTTEPAGATTRRPTLKLKPAPATRARLPAGTPTVPFWINWRRDAYRPKKRHATLESALAERERLRALFPDAAINTFECQLVEPQGEP